jgi:hypothetical protein
LAFSLAFAGASVILTLPFSPGFTRGGPAEKA